jgi:hypothetical protein
MLIPKEPNIPLLNYLLSLRDDIKIIGASDILKNWHNLNFDSYAAVSKKLSISESFYRRIITGKNPLPIWILKILNQFDNSLLKTIYNANIYFTARNCKDNLPKSINPELAYYIGYLHGDGHIDSNGKRVSFFDKYVGQLTIMKRLTKILFNVQGKIRIRKNKKTKGEVPTLDIRRVTINSFLSEVIGIKRGKRDSNDIPSNIQQNKILLKWYLCGLFDAEGAMPLNPKKRRDVYIDIAMKDVKLINSIKILLESKFDIHSYGPYKRIAKNPKFKNPTVESELKIRKLSEIKKFLNSIGTMHPDKLRRKELILSLLN